MKNIIFIIIVLFFFCCKPRNTTIYTDSYKVINLDQRNAYFNWKASSEIVDMISLETSDLSLIDNISKVIIYGDYIIIKDGYSKGMVFNIEGEFKHFIGSIGKGPGEYMELRDMFIDQNEGVLHALHYKKINEYRISDGAFLKSTKLKFPKNSGFNPNNFLPTDENSYYLWSLNPDVWNPESGDYYFLVKYRNNKIIKRYFKYEHYDIDGDRFFIDYKNEVFIKPILGNYNIYQIKNVSIFLKYNLNHNNGLSEKFFQTNKKFVPKSYYSEKAYKSIDEIYQTENYLYISMDGTLNERYEILCNKKNMECKTYLRKPYEPSLCFADRKYLYFIYDPSNSRNEECLSYLNNYWPEGMVNLTHDIGDNPIIIKLKLNKII